jgi:hypothetical protein
MRKWNRIFSLGGLCMVAGVVTAQHPPPTRTDALIERGKYLVMHVAMCVQCHTSRDEHGALDWSHFLRGAPMPVTSPFPNQQWVFRAPTLAGLPGWETEDAVTL